MAAQPWPLALQQNVNQAGFQESFGETTIRSNNDIGPVKVRRRSTRPIDTYTTNILVTASEYSVFKTFYNTTINGGSGTFTFNHPITGVLSEWRMSTPPSLSTIGFNTYNISMTWEYLGVYV